MSPQANTIGVATGLAANATSAGAPMGGKPAMDPAQTAARLHRMYLNHEVTKEVWYGVVSSSLSGFATSLTKSLRVSLPPSPRSSITLFHRSLPSFSSSHSSVLRTCSSSGIGNPRSPTLFALPTKRSKRKPKLLFRGAASPFVVSPRQSSPRSASWLSALRCPSARTPSWASQTWGSSSPTSLRSSHGSSRAVRHTDASCTFGLTRCTAAYQGEQLYLRNWVDRAAHIGGAQINLIVALAGKNNVISCEVTRFV